MNENIRKTLAYSLNFISFIMLEKISEKILSVYLFGSSIRDELDKESDIDIFISCKKADEDEILKSAEIAEKRFRLSKDFDKWKLLYFTYPFSIKTGNIDEWELKNSIKTEGIQLFSKNVTESSHERSVIFIIDLPKNKKTYLSLTRELFGRKDKNFTSMGLVEKQNGIKLGAGIFMTPKTSQTEFISLLHKQKINFRMIEVTHNT
jgi:predicted nucleotidyltransferase